MAGLGRLTLSRRERMVLIEPRGPGMVLVTLRSTEEVRPAQFDGVESKVDPEMVAVAEMILTRRAGHFDPSQFEDRYENALIDLLRKKQAGEKIEPAREAPPPRVVNLMDALRASIDAEEKKAPAPSTRARRPAKKKATR